MAFLKKKKTAQDPLANPKFRGAGFFENLRETIVGDIRPLTTVQIEITSVCGSKCGYCPHTTMAEKWHSRHISAEVMASLWPLLRNAHFAHLQGWGEPLLHPRFFDFVKFAAKAGCQTSTTSCGARLNEEILDRLVKEGPEVIAFSLVGTDSQSNKARAGADFDEVCANISKLAEKIGEAGHGPEIHLAYLLLADQMDAVKKLPDLMEKLDVKAAVVSTLDYLALPDQKELAFAPYEHEKIDKARKLLTEAADRAKAAGRQIIFGLPDEDTICETGCRENIANSLYVDADGQISPCVYLNVPARDTARENVVFGNSLEDNIWEIWKKPEYRDFRDSLVSGDTPAQCLHCPKRKEKVFLGE